MARISQVAQGNQTIGPRRPAKERYAACRDLPAPLYRFAAGCSLQDSVYHDEALLKVEV